MWKENKFYIIIVVILIIFTIYKIQINKEKYNIPESFVKENNLPPYPGKDGGPGLYGTDINHNNIRDDLEREIAWVFRNNSEVRDMFYAIAVFHKLDMDLAVKKDYSSESNREMKRRMLSVLDCEDYYRHKKYSGSKTLSEEQQKYGDGSRFWRRYYYSTSERKKMTISYENGYSEAAEKAIEEGIKTGREYIEVALEYHNRGRKPGEKSPEDESNYRKWGRFTMGCWKCKSS